MADRQDCITVGLRWEPRTFNPFRSVDSASYFAQSLVYGGLLRYGASGKIEPDLASSFSISKSESTPEFTYRFVMRDKLFFSDGSPVLAKDVIRSIKEAAGPGSPFRNNFQLLKEIKSHGREILVTFKGADVSLPSRFVDLKILPSRVLDADKEQKAVFEREPISSGAFTLKDWQSGQQIVFQRNPHYWDALPQYKELCWRVIPDKKLLAMALLRKEIDMASLDGREAKRLISQAPFLKVERVRGARVVFLGFNVSKWPYSEESVRRAIALMIDRKQINKQLFGGLSHVPESEFSELDGQHSKPVVDLDEAARLLKEAGFRKEGDNWVLADDPGAGALSVRVVSVSDFLDIGQVVVSDLKRGLVDAELEVVEYATLKDQYLKDGKFDLVLFSRSVGPVPDARMFWSTTGNLNYSKYHNPKMDKLIAYSSRASTMDDKHKYNRLIGKLLAREQPWIYLSRPDLLLVHNQRVSNVISSPQREAGIPWNNELLNARLWKLKP